MPEIIFQFFSVSIAWILALTFIHMKLSGILFNSLLTAILCTATAFSMDHLGYDMLLFPAETLLFLLVMVIVQLQSRNGYGAPVMAFLLAQSANSVLYFTGHFAYTMAGLGGIVVAAVLVAVYLILTVKLKKRFPDEDWRAYYTKSVPEPERLQLHWGQMYLIPAVVCLLLTASAVGIQAADMLRGLLWSAAGSMVLWFGILLMILMNAYKKERIAVLVEQQYRGEMQSFLNVIRSQRHDYNFHVQTIAGLMQEGKLEECKKYVNALEKDSEMMNAVLPVKDPAISAMIHNFRTLAAREGIELHIDIQNDLAQICTNVYETNKIISNLLQNAIDETATHKDKSYGIWLCILKRGEYCVIRVSNEVGDTPLSAREVGRIYQQGYTTKQGHDGVGLSSIQNLASRYKGMIYTQMEDKVIHFIAKIPINYAKGGEDYG